MIWVKVGAVIVLLMVIAIVIGSFMHEDVSAAELEPDQDPVPLQHPRFRK